MLVKCHYFVLGYCLLFIGFENIARPKTTATHTDLMLFFRAKETVKL